MLFQKSVKKHLFSITFLLHSKVNFLMKIVDVMEKNFHVQMFKNKHHQQHWFKNGGMEIHTVGWGVLTLLFYEDPLYCLPAFFKFCPTSTTTSLSPPTPTPTVLSIMDNMDLHMSSLATLVPEGSWCVFYATRHQVNWGLIHEVFYWWSDLITHKHTQHTQGPVDWHTCIIIYWHHLLCAHSNYLYYIKWLNEWFTDIEIYFPQCLFFSNIIQL